MQVTVQHSFPSAALAAAFLASLPADGGAVVTGTPAGNAPKAAETAATTTAPVPVKYFWNSTTDTLFEIKKGDKRPEGFSSSATEITAHEYETHKARLTEKFKQLQTAGASGAGTAASSTTATAAAEFDPFAEEAAAPAATAKEIDEPTLLAKLQELSKHQPDGRTFLMSLLERAGAKGVPAMLKGKSAAERGALFAEVTKHMAG